MKKILIVLLYAITTNAFAQNEFLVYNFLGYSEDLIFEKYLDKNSDSYEQIVAYYKQDLDSYIEKIDNYRYQELVTRNAQAKREAAAKRNAFLGALVNTALQTMQTVQETRARQEAEQQQQKALDEARRQEQLRIHAGQAGTQSTRTFSNIPTTSNQSVNNLYTSDVAKNTAIQLSANVYGAQETQKQVVQARTNDIKYLQSGERETFAVSKNGVQIKIRVRNNSVVAYRMGGPSGQEHWSSVHGATTVNTQYQYDGELSRDYKYKFILNASPMETFYFN